MTVKYLELQPSMEIGIEVLYKGQTLKLPVEIPRTGSNTGAPLEWVQRVFTRRISKNLFWARQFSRNFQRKKKIGRFLTGSGS